jgi:hypothetical protein
MKNMSGPRGDTDLPHPGGQAVARVEKDYTLQSRGFTEFKNQPKGLQFRLLGKKGNADVYKKGENKTIKYATDSCLFRIQLSDRCS